MNPLHFLRIITADIDSGSSEEMELLEKTAQIGPSFVVYIGFRDECDFETHPGDPDTELDILTHPGDPVSPGSLPDLSGDAHIETAGMVGCRPNLSTTDAAGGEKRGHRIVDRFLQSGKT